MSTTARMPKLWVSRLLIYSSLRPLKTIRDVPLRPGLNLVWAREPDDSTGLGTLQRAGHGVGKSTFCLMLRCLLGDAGKAVKGMRDALAQEFPDGGIAGIVHIGQSAWAVSRPFAANTSGMAAETMNLDSLLGGGEHVSFQSYLDRLTSTMLSGMEQRQIPGTGQSIEWGHVLGWITRDQGSRLSGYYHWRSTEGTGLQSFRQAQPWVVRSVLALTNSKEAQATRDVSSLEMRIQKLEESIKDQEAEPRLIRARIEADFRKWVGGSSELAFESDNLFKSSVLAEVKKREGKITEALSAIDEEIASATLVMVDRSRLAKVANEQLALAQANADEAEALRDNNQERLEAARGKLNELRNLAGPCKYGAVLFQECVHIQQRLQNPSFQEHRDQQQIQQSVGHWEREARQRREAAVAAEQELQDMQKLADAAAQVLRKLQMKRSTKDAERHYPQFLRQGLETWDAAAEGSAPAVLASKRSELESLNKQLNSAVSQIHTSRNERADRQGQLTSAFDALAQQIGLQGRFRLDNDTRPFELVGSAGEAYSVLEILLGDLACALDALSSDSLFPGFWIHDCPREADLSVLLYEAYLRVVASSEGESPAWQVIVTTTTPPPEQLQSAPYMALTLDPANDDGLLLRARFGMKGIERN